MDFIDPDKKRANKIRLLIGYVLIAILIGMASLVILYQVDGYGFGSNGQLIQKGLVFISSTPNPANIYLNGVLNTAQTNARLNLPAGEYTVKLVRNGYVPWQRAVGVEGGSVERFDYPFLIPSKLVTTNVQTYTSQPGLVLQSPDRRWLLVQQPGNDTNYIEYDLTNPKQLKPTTVTIPASIAAANVAGTSWKLVSWSTDNIHVLLDHGTGTTHDYIVLNRQTPDQSIDLTKTLGLNATTVPSFDNNHYDQYFLFDKAAGTLATDSLTNTQPTVVLNHVLAYKSYGSDVFLYAAADPADASKVTIKLQQGSTSYTLRQLRAGATTYLLNLTQYNGDWYVVAGDSSEDKTYVYKDPQAVLDSQPSQPLVPVAILKVDQPTFADFSANAQFIVAENGSDFAVFDAQNDKSYTYRTAVPIATGQHATWMDGDRLVYEGNGKIYMFDYDDANPHTLQAAVPGAVDRFDQAYKWSYIVAPTAAQTAPYALTQTALRIPADQ